MVFTPLVKIVKDRRLALAVGHFHSCLNVAFPLPQRHQKLAVRDLQYSRNYQNRRNVSHFDGLGGFHFSHPGTKHLGRPRISWIDPADDPQVRIQEEGTFTFHPVAFEHRPVRIGKPFVCTL